MTASRLDYKLSDRYRRDEGDVLITGIQALVRLPVEQSLSDRDLGLSTATFISGYEGSPLAGYDLELGRQRALLDEHDIICTPAVNEELAVNAVQGSQLAAKMESCSRDGIVGIWYGKAPGLDRATDAFRHANLGGASPKGGVLALVGDDSIAKSSSVPSSSEIAIAELGMPVLAPSDPQEILELGLHGIAMSRFSGLWVAMKLATNVVDGSATTTMRKDRIKPVIPDRTIDGAEFHHEVTAHFLQPTLGQLEASLVGARLELVRRYAVSNGLATTIGDPQARVGIITAGASYRDTRQALRRLGIDDECLDQSGVRILKLGLVHPIDPDTIAGFATGLDELIVIEEKKAFIELAVKDILFEMTGKPSVYGKRGPDRSPFMRAEADLPPELIATRLAERFMRYEAVRFRRQASPGLAVDQSRTKLPLLPLINRTPYYCSGCPHNRSTEVPSGALVGAGIGCHAIAATMPTERVGNIVGLCQMGGEGATWIGMAPFIGEKHFIQNLGDGTFHHSGILAIRASVAASSNITFKLLYNDAVAMTGGQQPIGKMPVPALARELLAEGVERVVVTTDDVKKYRGVRMPRGVKVADRDRLLALQTELAAVPGVTVIIHDQECATELRRKRKRKLVEEPEKRAFINERVCEGCGDCGQKSNCMSVQPVETAFGRKTRIDQATCNKDYSCLDGDCPSFVEVVPRKRNGKRNRRKLTKGIPATRRVDLPAPVMHTNLGEFSMRITGIGGTGVVTTAQIIATAASIAGAHVRGLDQLGLAQKGGAVVSDIKISREPTTGTNKIAPGECDLYLGCDVLVASTESNLSVASPEQTIAVVSTSQVPTGAMILAPGLEFPSTEETKARIDAVTRSELSVYADIRSISGERFGSEQYANIILVGMAVQVGALPLDPELIKKAIELNGVAVEANIRAFATGREIALDPAAFAGGRSRRRTDVKSVEQRTQIYRRLGPEASPETRELVARFVPELVAYQSAAYALRYVNFVEGVRKREAEALGRSGEITERFASALYKLMAYKDEYEVARLYLIPEFEEDLVRELGDDVRFSYKLHPPFLRALGVNKKITFGPWFKMVFRVLYALRRVRGTVLDPFGYAEVRRVERQLVTEFAETMLDVTDWMTDENRAVVQAIASLPEEIRGYEEVKLRNVHLYRERLGAALHSLSEISAASAPPLSR